MLLEGLALTNDAESARRRDEFVDGDEYLRAGWDLSRPSRGYGDKGGGQPDLWVNAGQFDEAGADAGGPRLRDLISRD